MSSVVPLITQPEFGASTPFSHFLARYSLSSAFQPIFSPTHQRLVGFEALVRLLEQGQQQPPSALFDQARAANQVEALDHHLLALHLESFSAQPHPTWLFLNISPDTCVHPNNYLHPLFSECRNAGIKPAQVVLEVVETSTSDNRALLNFVKQAKAWGFQIAIDDFGVGDSNFERMWQLEPLIVKLDRSMLVNAEHHSRARLLLESLVKMIRESGSLVLLEGIETEAQARIALSTEADLLQGFLFGRPEMIETQSTVASEQTFSRHLERIRQHSLDDIQSHQGYLRLLRCQVLEACHSLMRDDPFDQSCNTLLAVAGVRRCFLLNEQGIQQGGLTSTHPERKAVSFNPLYLSHGACWMHREYFRVALERPHEINASRPYVALPDAVRTVTLSFGLQLGKQRMVFCVDLHPDAVFDGNLSFPDSL